MYYEILMTLIDDMTVLKITDITIIIVNQQNLSNQMYLEAIEANFSHEQMTPLNTILNNSRIVYNRNNNIFESLDAELTDS